MALLRRVDDNWYQACTLDKTKVGYIPYNYLEVLIDVAAIPKSLLNEEIPEKTFKEALTKDLGHPSPPAAPLSGSYLNIVASVGHVVFNIIFSAILESISFDSMLFSPAGWRL